jgi:sugar phosphate isomerase/epimerase
MKHLPIMHTSPVPPTHATLSRRAWLAGAAGTLGLQPAARSFAQTAAVPAWSLASHWILASHLFEDGSFFELGPLLKELLPEPRRLDLWVAYSPDKTGKHFNEIRKRGIPAAREYCEQQGVSLAVATCYGTKGYAAYADEIHQLGCQLSIQSSGRKTSGTITGMMKKELENCKPALELAEKHGCRIAIENHSGNFLLNELDSFKAFMDLCEHPLLGLAFAPFHTQGRAQSPEQYLEVCLPKVFYLYAWQQNPAGGQLAEKAGGEAQMPGVGPYDFGPLIELLRKNNSDALVSPFMHRATTSARSAELARQAMAYLGKL